MALGGGVYYTQNKSMPGTYINFTSLTRATASLSDRGVVAAPLFLKWGPEGKVFEMSAEDFPKKSLTVFGYESSAPEMLHLRELFRHATKVLVYRLSSGGAKASNTFATAKYPGSRGNNIKIAIANDPDGVEGDHIVTTYLDSTVVDTQHVAKNSNPKNNDFVDFEDGAIGEETEETPGLSLAGGTETFTNACITSALTALESYSFNTLCCCAKASTSVALFTAYTKRMRDERGVKFQTVVPFERTSNNAFDYEGIILSGSESDLPTGYDNVTLFPETTSNKIGLVFWIAGALAGAAVNESCTNMEYDGELTVDTSPSQAALEAAIAKGAFVLHKVNGAVKVLRDINSFITETGSKNASFRDNRTVRVCDTIANNIAVIFADKYLGKVANDADGRSALWSDVSEQVRNLVNQKAVENFDSANITVSLGDDKGSVVISIDALEIAGAMEKLYMDIVIK